MGTVKINKRTCLIFCMLFSSGVMAGERIGYEAEHALEVPLN